VDSRWKTSSALPTEIREHPLLKAASNKTATWWRGESFPDLGTHFDKGPATWAGLGLLRKALEGGEPVRQATWEGNLIVPHKDLIEATKKILNVRPLYLTDFGNNNGVVLLGSEDTWVNIRQSERGQTADVQIVTSSLEDALKSEKLFNACIQPDDPRKGLVFALTKCMTGYSLTRLGTAGTPLERGNYTDAVLADYDHVVADLKTPGPCGRLIIFSGSPGTGKTFLVRALLTEVPNAAFVLIPPQMVSDLGAPELLPALLNAKNEINGPIILILEDGDKALVKRKDGDMNTISSLLNLGDGILGSIMDIRILATTNAETLEMDPATRRKGRLCRHIQIDALPAEQGSQIVQRLTNNPYTFKGDTVLADVYSAAREKGWKPAEVVPPRPEARPEIIGVL